MLRSLATLVGLGGTHDGQPKAAAEEEDDFEAYLLDEGGGVAGSDAESDDDLDGLVQPERDRNAFPPDDIPVEPPAIARATPGKTRECVLRLAFGTPVHLFLFRTARLY